MKKNIILFSTIFFLSASCGIFGNNGLLGTMKTTDGGSSWQQSNATDKAAVNIAGLSIAEMGFEPGNHEVIYLASVNSGLWKSSDSAGKWKQILSKITAYDYFVDPSNTQNIFVTGVYGNHGRIIRSRDGGITWEEVYSEASANNSVNTISANPANSREVFSGLNSGVLIKSIDGGDSWLVVNDFNNQILKVRYVNKTIYVLTRSKGLYESVDNGAKWTNTTESLTGSGGISSYVSRTVEQFYKISIDDQAAGVIYLTTNSGLYKTTDDGKNWQLQKLPVESSAPRAIASTRGGMLAYTSIGNTIFKTLDGGKSWQTQSLATTNVVNKIIIDPLLPQVSYAGFIEP
ncbi:MAG: WD40/YVTN/BNR-like repeat-containing protein [Candidatus Doudnabacteria bacterium]